MNAALQSTQTELIPADPKWELKELSLKHKEVCALIAQGQKRSLIATLTDFTPEYITMLARQPLCIAYIKQMNEFTGIRLDAMFAQSVDVIADVMQHGDNQERLKAARLQMEATKRIGPRGDIRTDPAASVDRLDKLADRLTSLIVKARGYSDVEEIEDATFIDASSQEATSQTADTSTLPGTQGN